MRRLLLVGLIGALASAEARAEGWPPKYPRPYPEYHGWGPHTTSVTWPSLTPPGWYSNTYAYRWQYPWFAYYNYSAGPYANWPATAAVAGYAYHGPAGMYYSNKEPAEPYTGNWFTGDTPGVQRARQMAADAGAFNSLQGLTAPPKKDDKKDSKEEKKDEKPKQ